MSKTLALHPRYSALKKAYEYLATDKWIPINEGQESFLEPLKGITEDLKHIDEIKSLVSTDAAELNKMLEEENFSIRFQPFNQNEFGVVSILNALFKWLEIGEEKSIIVDNVSYSAFSLNNFNCHNVNGQIIFRLKTQNMKDTVCIAIPNNEKIAEQSGYGWASNIIINLFNKRERKILEYDSIYIPMVDLRCNEDISFLVGMKTGLYTITQALQESILKMNEFGARVKSAVSLECLGGCFDDSKKIYVVDKPFYFWVERKDVKIPIFMAYVTKNDWKKPELNF